MTRDRRPNNWLRRDFDTFSKVCVLWLATYRSSPDCPQSKAPVGRGSVSRSFSHDWGLVGRKSGAKFLTLWQRRQINIMCWLLESQQQWLLPLCLFFFFFLFCLVEWFEPRPSIPQKAMFELGDSIMIVFFSSSGYVPFDLPRLLVSCSS